MGLLLVWCSREGTKGDPEFMNHLRIGDAAASN
jgi:hypothetical protein